MRTTGSTASGNEAMPPMLAIRDLQHAYVGEAAIAWDQARRVAARLKAERAACRCEHECDADYDDNGRMTYEGDPACWRATWQDQRGEDRHPPMDEWCEPCRKRQAIHVEYRKAVAHRQALLRGLQRRALAAWEASQSIDAVDPSGDSNTGNLSTRDESSVQPSDVKRGE